MTFDVCQCYVVEIFRVSAATNAQYSPARARNKIQSRERGFSFFWGAFPSLEMSERKRKKHAESAPPSRPRRVKICPEKCRESSLIAFDLFVKHSLGLQPQKVRRRTKIAEWLGQTKNLVSGWGKKWAKIFYSIISKEWNQIYCITLIQNNRKVDRKNI